MFRRFVCVLSMTMLSIPNPRTTTRLALISIASCLLLSVLRLHAGGGPENWLVVYDPGSPHSVAVARHYQAVRGFPESHLMPYAFPRAASVGFEVKQRLSIDETWDFIEAIRAHANARELLGQIDGITLAGMTPTMVTPSSGNPASLIAALWHAPGAATAAELDGLVANGQNELFRGPSNGSSGALEPTVAVDSQTDYAGKRYWMATHLGFNGAKGLRTEEVFALIDRSAAADGSHPEGTVYWPLNGNVRSTLRQDQIDVTTAEWDALGLPYHIEGEGFGGVSHGVPQMFQKTGAPGSHPIDERLVQGEIVGRSTLDVVGAEKLFTPGAIAEHLTSVGGNVNELFNASQTAHTEWLRAGASGSSGTVFEPFAVWTKFPHARIHSHYFRGATLAEAFIQSVDFPVQLMVSGDPLTQPYAELPEVAITAPVDGAVVSGTLAIEANASSPLPLDAPVLAVNGRIVDPGDPTERVDATRTAGGFELDTATLPDGWSELRVIARNAGGLRSQRSARIEVRIDNASRSVGLDAPTSADFRGSVSVSVAPVNLGDAERIEIRSGGQVLATLGPGGGSAQFPASRLSYHTSSRIFAVAITPEGEVWSAPQTVSLEWMPLPATPRPQITDSIAAARVFGNVTASGFSWEDPADFVAPVDDLGSLVFSSPEAIPFLNADSAGQSGVELVALFKADRTGVYDFAFQGTWAEAELLVDGSSVVPESELAQRSVYYGTERLEAGLHELRIRLKPLNGTLRFEAGYRNRNSFFFDRADFAPFSAETCAAPADLAYTRVLPSARFLAPSQLKLGWTAPFSDETEWRVERFAGAPEVSLIAYNGTNTLPTLEPASSPKAIQVDAPVNNDGSDRWLAVPPQFFAGVRLLTAEADRNLVDRQDPSATADLYQVRVPAGVTIYGIFHRNTPNQGPDWMQAQGDWTSVSLNVQSAEWPDWEVWKKAPTASSGIVDLGHGGVPWGRAVSYVFLFEPLWSVEAVTAGGSRMATIDALEPGPHEMRLSARFPGGVEYVSPLFEVVAGSAETNGMPTVDAGRDRRAVLGTAVPLDGIAVDDGLPDAPSALAINWTQISGPGSTSFADPGSARTTADFSLPGSYVLQLEADDGARTGTDTVAIEVLAAAAANAAPLVDAGADRSTHTGASIKLAASVSDDGLPAVPGQLDLRWTQTAGPANALLLDSGALDSAVAFPAPGIYRFTLSASDGLAESSDTVQVTVTTDPNAPPQVDAGSRAESSPGEQIQLGGSVSDDGSPGPVTFRWEQISGPAEASIADPSRLDASVGFPPGATGLFVFRLHASDGARRGQAFLVVEVTFDTSGNTPPSVTAANPIQDAIWLDLLHLAHSVEDDGLPAPPAAVSGSWSLLEGPAGGEFRAEVKADLSGSRIWLTRPGTYRLRFEASDGATAGSADFTIHSAERATRGITWYWGQNRSDFQPDDFRGNPGTLATATNLSPRPVARSWRKALHGFLASIALDRDGRVWTQGKDSSHGQLGDAAQANRRGWDLVEGLDEVEIVDIVSANSFMAALAADGRVFTWGDNRSGQLGHGENVTDPSPIPLPVVGLDDAVQIDAGVDFMAARLADGTVRTWGEGGFYRLGNGSDQDTGLPQNIGLTDVRQIALGSYFGIALLEDGTLQAWGRNDEGQLGNGTMSFSSFNETPQPVLDSPGGAPLSGVVEIACGDEFVLARKADGSVWGWGYNGQGNLANGNFLDQPVPIRINGLPTAIAQIAAAEKTSFARDANGEVWAAGSNETELLGISRNIIASSRPTMAKVPGLPEIATIHAREKGVFALTPGQTREDFLQAHFTSDEQTNPAISGDEADPDKDGLPNRIERFLGRDPRRPESVPPIRFEPVGDRLRLSFEALAVADDLDARILESSDLSAGSWKPARPDDVFYDDGGDHRVWHYDFDPAGGRSKFLKLEVD